MTQNMIHMCHHQVTHHVTRHRTQHVTHIMTHQMTHNVIHPLTHHVRAVPLKSTRKGKTPPLKKILPLAVL